MPSKWIEHIKEFAKSNGMSYKDALKDPKCKSSYHEKGKGVAVEEPKKEENVEMKVEEVKKGRGRPKKYATEEEAKKAKSVKTMESNKRKKAEKGGAIAKPIGMPNPLKEEGKGLNAGYKVEAPNGLGHIYPISHELVLQMLKH